MRRPPVLTLPATLLTVVVLAACTAGGDAAPSPSGTAAADASPDASATAPPPPDEPLAPATAECVQGTWTLDLEAVQDDLRRVLAGNGGAVELDVAGTTTYELVAGGEFRAAVDSSSSVTFAGDDGDLTSTAASSGDLTGVWSLEGDTLVISDVDTADLDVTTTASLDGEPVDVPAGSAEDSLEALPPTTSTASCGPARMTLVSTLVQDEDAEPVTITYTLRR